MTFDVSDQHVAVRDRARALAQTIQPRSADIDRNGAVPDDIVRDVRQFVTDDRLALVLAIEELAVASAAAAAVLGAAPDAGQLALTGMRGAPTLEPSPRGQLMLAAVALGIGRAAIDESLAALRPGASGQGREVERPHWVVADAATELDAARLVSYKAAQTGADADIAMARLLASAAAARAVDAAVRVVGSDALTSGSTIERVSRDVRAVSVLLGSEEDQRSVAAEALLPKA